MRIIFIPGFAEDEFAFSKIAPLIAGEQLILNSYKLLGDEQREDFNALKFAQEFIATYKITERDILIGHSMGGWIAYHVKHFVGCRIIHIASLTNTDRIIPPAVNNAAVHWAVRQGLVFNKLTTSISSLGFYHHDYSKDIFMYCAHLLEKANTENIVNQLKLLLNPVDAVITIQPDLRIHGKEDNILRPPAEPYHKVSGDHFTLFTHPEEVSVPIIQYLASQTS
jgi:hypothetical protein